MIVNKYLVNTPKSIPTHWVSRFCFHPRLSAAIRVQIFLGFAKGRALWVIPNKYSLTKLLDFARVGD